MSSYTIKVRTYEISRKLAKQRGHRGKQWCWICLNCGQTSDTGWDVDQEALAAGVVHARVEHTEEGYILRGVNPL
jgi:hypothetical protein